MHELRFAPATAAQGRDSVSKSLGVFTTLLCGDLPNNALASVLCKFAQRAAVLNLIGNCAVIHFISVRRAFHAPKQFSLERDLRRSTDRRPLFLCARRILRILILALLRRHELRLGLLLLALALLVRLLVLGLARALLARLTRALARALLAACPSCSCPSVSS